MADRRDRCGGICCLEDSASCNEYGRTVRCGECGIVGSDAAVDLDFNIISARTDHTGYGFGVRHGFRHELLSAESRFYRHNQDHIDIRQQRFKNEGGGCRLDGNGSLTACSTDRLQDLDLILTAFVVNGDAVSPCLDEVIDVTDGIGDHQMDVEKEL